MKRAFLEKIGGEWLDDFVYMSKQPLLEREFEVIEFDGDDMENTLLNHNFNVPGDIIIGSVQATVKFFEACGISTPHYLGYPLELKPYFGRKISSMYGSDLKYIKKPKLKGYFCCHSFKRRISAALRSASRKRSGRRSKVRRSACCRRHSRILA